MEPTGESRRPLNVAIVGAGIGGLAAAISLRRNGHHVRIFESSQTKTEIGAGLGIPRNAVRVLKHFGYSKDNLKANAFHGAELFDAKTGIGAPSPLLVPNVSEDAPDICCHRSDLYSELKRLATGEGAGPPAQLLLNSKVSACDPEAGTITLSDGETITADVVIGADGIHSIIRTAIVGHTVRPPASGWSCFRCVFDASTLNDIPELNWVTEGINGAKVLISRDGTGPPRSLFVFKCRNGSLLNFVDYHTDSAQDDPTWSAKVTLEEITSNYKDFHPKFMRLFDLPAHSAPLRWQLRAVPVLPTWTRGRAALLGDAAHATFPFLGQGAAMAMEEAAALGCLLPLGATKADVPARLAGYQALRKQRGEFVRSESLAQATPEKRGTYLKSPEMQGYMFEYDAVKAANEYYETHFVVV
ncbi:FAD/NAD(P)-binding domain-containing protein [Mycena filopes]|nr:FAD/NAD(P)-binding domain-containing protein [Mycena filopes]